MYVHLCIYVCMRMYMHVCLSVYMYVVNVHMCVCENGVCVCVYVCAGRARVHAVGAALEEPSCRSAQS